MPKCKNDKTREYKGTEPSPKGLGYCAHVEKIGTKKKGLDGNMWIVKKISSGSKRWSKYSKSRPNIEKLKSKKLKKNLKDVGVDLFVTKWYPEGNYYIIDSVWNSVSEKYGKEYGYLNNHNFIIVPLKMNGQSLVLDNDKIFLQHNGITYKTKKKVIDILQKEFKSDYKWSGKQNEAIEIKV